jgi:alkylhydroperoxidase family enzyme
MKHGGLDIDRLKHIDDYHTSPTYTRAERLAVAYADAMSTIPVSVTDEQVTELREEFGDEGVLELTYQIGLENMRARMYSALDVRDQGFSSGDACRLPEADITAQARG